MRFQDLETVYNVLSRRREISHARLPLLNVTEVIYLALGNMIAL